MRGGGVPLDLQENDIIDALKRNHGQTKACANDFNCTRETFLKYLYLYPDALKLRNKLRFNFPEIVLDMAEDNIGTLLEACDSTSTYFTLNMRGRKRGWSKEELEERNEMLTLLLSVQKQNFELQAALLACHSALRAAGVPLPEVPGKSESSDPAHS